MPVHHDVFIREGENVVIKLVSEEINAHEFESEIGEIKIRWNTLGIHADVSRIDESYTGPFVARVA